MNLAQTISRIVDEKLRQLKLDASKGNAISGDTWTDSTQKVKTLNTLSGDVTISAGANVTLTPSGNNIEIASESGGASAFTELSDAPSAYTGQGGKIVAVKSDVSGLEFVAAPAAANGIPTGGTAGQILKKIDGTDYNTEWGDEAGNSYTLPQATASALGGIKAAEKTSAETGEVKIDAATGKLYAPAGGSSGDTPVSGIVGCTVWLKADAITGLSDGDTVTIWENSASDIHDYRAVNTPKYKTNILNSKPAILMDDGYFSGYMPFENQLVTWFLVCKTTTLSVDYTAVIGMGVNSDKGGYYVKSNGKTALYMSTSSVSYNGTGAATIGTTAFNIITSCHRYDAIKTRVNKAADQTGTLIVAPNNNDISLGHQYNQPTRDMNGYIAEFIAYNKQLTDDEVISVENYLNTKYALGL